MSALERCAPILTWSLSTVLYVTVSISILSFTRSIFLTRVLLSFCSQFLYPKYPFIGFGSNYQLHYLNYFFVVFNYFGFCYRTSSSG